MVSQSTNRIKRLISQDRSIVAPFIERIFIALHVIRCRLIKSGLEILIKNFFLQVLLDDPTRGFDDIVVVRRNLDKLRVLRWERVDTLESLHLRRNI